MSEMQDRGRLVVLEQGNVPAHVKCRNYVLVDRDRGWIQLYELDRQQVIVYNPEVAREIAQALIEAADIAEAAPAAKPALR